MGLLAYFRGDYDTAEQHYQAALALFEGNRQPGDISPAAPPSRDYRRRATAITAPPSSITGRRWQILEEIGLPQAIAGTYGQLGSLAKCRGDYDTAEQRYQAALADL